MLKKIREKYFTSAPFKDTLMTYDFGVEETQAKKGGQVVQKENEKLEKKILKLFGVLLQLIVFYLPLMNMIFRGKAVPGIIS